MYDERTALVVVDMQNDFAHPDGGLYVAPPIVDEVNREILKADEAGSLVVYTQDWHPAETKHFEQWPVHCVKGTWGARLHFELLPPDGNVVIRKGINGEDGYSAFSIRTEDGVEEPTALDRVLSANDIFSVVVVGIALDVCVKATALDAVGLAYETAVVLDATAAVNDADGAVSELVDAGVTVL